MSTMVIASMTYVNAKRTVFQPLKTEVFKKQIESLTEVLRIFVGKEELALRGDFDFELLRHANITKMYDAYVAHAFNRERPYEDLEYRAELCPTMIVSIEHLQRNFTLVDGDKPPSSKNEGQELLARRRGWKYCAAEISLPSTYSEMTQRIRAALEDPFLPSPIGRALEDYLGLVERNAFLISQIIAEMSDQMPRRYPSVMDLGDAQTEWIENQVHDHFEDLRPSAEKIIMMARDYFNSDGLLPKKSTWK
ncbi:hypothetical protein [Kitasatospora sp. NPDC094016]|uniref:hypothetical protein n=1 Tax=Kitasatospora sp. NPDC094016 TaxID=3154986 RepID=UPI003317025E